MTREHDHVGQSGSASDVQVEGAGARSCDEQRGGVDRILFQIRSSPSGSTHEFLAAATKIRLDTVKARVHDLGELGLVRVLKQLGKTSTGSGALLFVAAEHVDGRELEAWPVKRRDWRQEAIDQERRAIDAETRCRQLEERLARMNQSKESAA